MNKYTFFSLASDSLLFAIGRAHAFRIPQAIIDLWVLQHRAKAARSVI